MVEYDSDYLGALCAAYENGTLPEDSEAVAICMIDSVSISKNGER